MHLQLRLWTGLARALVVRGAAGMRVVTRGNATTYGGGHPTEHDLAGSVRTQVWDWEGTRQSHEKNGKRTCKEAAREN